MWKCERVWARHLTASRTRAPNTNKTTENKRQADRQAGSDRDRDRPGERDRMLRSCRGWGGKCAKRVSDLWRCEWRGRTRILQDNADITRLFYVHIFSLFAPSFRCRCRCRCWLSYPDFQGKNTGWQVGGGGCRWSRIPLCVHIMTLFADYSCYCVAAPALQMGANCVRVYIACDGVCVICLYNSTETVCVLAPKGPSIKSVILIQCVNELHINLSPTRAHLIFCLCLEAETLNGGPLDCRWWDRILD